MKKSIIFSVLTLGVFVAFGVFLGAKTESKTIAAWAGALSGGVGGIASFLVLLATAP